jgi:hypothetical protein
LAFVSLLNQSNNQLMNQSPPATAGHNSLRRNYFRVILLPGYIIPFHFSSNPSYHTRRRYSTDMITTRADRTNKSHHGVSMVLGTWVHGYIRVHDNTTTLAFVSSFKQSNHSTHPGLVVLFLQDETTSGLHYTRSSNPSYATLQPHSITASQPKPTERTSHYHTSYIRVHDNTKRHETTRHALV